jgi:hypothetical protein
MLDLNNQTISVNKLQGNAALDSSTRAKPKLCTGQPPMSAGSCDPPGLRNVSRVFLGVLWQGNDGREPCIPQAQKGG